MMENVRIRIWDERNKRWFQGGTSEERYRYQTEGCSLFGDISLTGSLFIDQHDESGISIKRLDDLTVEQHTCLFDKTLKPIYEGDILINGAKEVAQVAFIDGSFWAIRTEGAEYRLCARVAKHLKIVGNIHENSELLERQS